MILNLTMDIICHDEHSLAMWIKRNFTLSESGYADKVLARLDGMVLQSEFGADVAVAMNAADKLVVDMGDLATAENKQKIIKLFDNARIQLDLVHGEPLADWFEPTDFTNAGAYDEFASITDDPVHVDALLHVSA